MNEKGAIKPDGLSIWNLRHRPKRHGWVNVRRAELDALLDVVEAEETEEVRRLDD